MMRAASFRDIAVIGVACRFPGASTAEMFWENLIGGIEFITRFSDEELLAAGVEPRLLSDPHYVKAAPILAEYDGFDAAFFGYAPREARLMDPQQRLFLEVAWEAFEDAGYDPLGNKGIVGIYAGAGGLEHIPLRSSRIRRGQDSGNTRQRRTRPAGGRLWPTARRLCARRLCATASSAWQRASRSG